MAAFIAYGMRAYLLTLAIPRRRIQFAVVLLLGSVVLLVGFSRIYLGAHWFSDVVGGFAAGAGWLGFCICLIEDVRVLICAACPSRNTQGSLGHLFPQQPAPSPAIVVFANTA